MPPLYPPNGTYPADTFTSNGYGANSNNNTHHGHPQPQAAGHAHVQVQPHMYHRNAQSEYPSHQSTASGYLQQANFNLQQQQQQQQQHPTFPAAAYGSSPQFYDQRHAAFYSSPQAGMNYQQPYQSSTYIHSQPTPQLQFPSQAPSQSMPQQITSLAPGFHGRPQVQSAAHIQRPSPSQQQYYSSQPIAQPHVQYGQTMQSSVGTSARSSVDARAPSQLLTQQFHQQSPRLSEHGQPQLLTSPSLGSPAQIQTQVQQRQAYPYQSHAVASPLTSQVTTPIHAQRLSASPAPRHSPQVSMQPLERVQSESQTWAQRPSHVQSPVIATPPLPQHRVAHVEIPVQRVSSSDYATGASTMIPPPKRRKSNDAGAIPLYQPAPVAKHQPTVQPTHTIAPPSSSLTDIRTSQAAPPSPPAPSVDYQAVLLGLSDEYIKAAYSMSTSLAGHEVPEDRLDDYYGYLATGMSCLESVLNNYRIPDARKEARIRLRLANLMHEETENDMEAEALLTKGIALCERSRLPNLKYSMHHLLARIWFKGGQAKAAMKAVDKLVDEVEKLDLPHWVYAFRFLRVSFGLQVHGFHAELGTLLKQIAAIVAMSSSNHDIAVHIVASAMEALIHLRSRAADGVDQAQRALAAARTHQLSSEMEDMPQVRALLNAVDLACNLVRFTPDQVGAQLSALRQNLDAYYEDSGQSKEGYWLLPLSRLPANTKDIEADTGGILKETPTGDCGLSLTWLTRTQATTMGFLLSALTGMQKANSEQKTENTLREGINLNKVPSEQTHLSLSAASAHSDWRHGTKLLLQTYAVFACCGRSEWEVAMKGIGNVRQSLYANGTQPGEDTVSLVAYLEATCKHGLGDLSGALQLYQSTELQLPANLESKDFTMTGSAPVKVLAALNSVPILRKFGAVQEADELLARIEPLCLVNLNSNGNEHGNKAIESAYFVLKATDTDMTIIKTKQYIQYAIQAAQRVTNDRLLTIVMNQMTHLFFANIVGRQAEQSAKVGRTLAKKSCDRLWTAVADGMMCDTLEKSGNMVEAEGVRREGQQAMASLPPSLKSALFVKPTHVVN